MASAQPPKWDPEFALQSSFNWIECFADEVVARYGGDSRHLHSAIEAKLSNIKTAKKSIRPETGGRVFGSLFQAITSVLALEEIGGAGGVPAWVYPGATVQWYYAVYAAANALLCLVNDSVPGTHAKTSRAWMGIRKSLPHPLNMFGKRDLDSRYKICLPDYPAVTNSGIQLGGRCRGSDDERRAYLLSYLNGTCRYYVENKKDELKSELQRRHGLADYRTKVAREFLYRNLQEEIGFLHCAYRFRGKANYRDSIFMCYGHHNAVRFDGQYINNLCIIARFLTIVSLQYCRRKLGKRMLEMFITDIESELRHGQQLKKVRKWWVFP